MTTVATDGKSMAADGLSLDGDGLICSLIIRKARRLKDGRVMGAAGNPFDLDALEQWLNEGGDFPELQDDEEFDLLVLETNGSVFSYAKLGRRSSELLPIAIGSGRELAVGAMEAGATPFEAVEIACKRHNGSGGKIIAFDLVND
jgi:ATP-dependent protease HslVU (ClpYQ) peptidase subunit